MYNFSTAQIARALDRKRKGLPVEPHLHREIVALPRVKSPLEMEVEQLRDKLGRLTCQDSDDDFVVRGFADH